MRQWLRSHMTYANVMVTILAFLVLTGGTAVALSGSNTVFTDDIANDTQPASGGNPAGGLVAADLRPNSVAASEVLNRSLGQAEFAKSIPAAHVTHSTTQTIAGTLTTLAFNTERYDTASMHDNATNNSRLTAPVTGIYAVTAQVWWGGSADGDRNLALFKNGTTELGWDERPGNDPYQELTIQVRLAAGDFVEVKVDEGGTGNQNVNSFNEFSPEFAMTWLAPGP
jgi:uncharacterized iron-regulated membrane protein